MICIICSCTANKNGLLDQGHEKHRKLSRKYHTQNTQPSIMIDVLDVSHSG